MPKRYQWIPSWRASPWFIGVVAFLFCWGTFLVYYQVKFDLNIPPSTSGDEVDYDSIAWELSQGRGFRVSTEDDEFRRPYDFAAQDDDRFLLLDRESWIVTYRPPLYPYAMSLLNRFFGRQFWATRLMDAAFIAATIAFLVTFLVKHYGWQPALIALLFFVFVDVRTRLYGRAILTEAMALFWTTLLCYFLMKLADAEDKDWRSLYRQIGLIGVIYGLTLLTRTFVITWLPWLVLLILALVWRLKKSAPQAISASILFATVAGLVFLPWAIRNIQVTGKFMPLGTQGQVQLSAAFGDEIWQSQGLWTNLHSQGFFKGVESAKQTRLERELAHAEYSKQRAIQWILANPFKSLALVPLKIWQECRPRNVTEVIILFFALIGVTTHIRDLKIRILLSVFLMNLFGIALTWSVEGRFLVPLLFVVHAWAAIGAWWCLKLATEVLSRRQPCNQRVIEES